MRLSEARLSIDRQMPDLTYLGLAFWMLWNTIGFSGSFWMHESVSPIVSEHLSLAHLLACIVTLCVIAGMPQRFRNIVAKNWCTAIGALIACAGTGCIVATPYASEPPLLPLFLLGCACTGFGTTLLFHARRTALWGTTAEAGTHLAHRVPADLEHGFPRARLLRQLGRDRFLDSNPPCFRAAPLHTYRTRKRRGRGAS